MRLRNSAVPGVDPVSGSDDRNRWSPDVVSDADGLARACAQLSAHVQALSDRAAQLQQAGYPEAEWLLARFQSHRLACPDLSGPSARILLQAGLAALEEHRAGLARDAAELERVEAAAAQAQAEAARKEAAEREARARREAQATAARTPAPPTLAQAPEPAASRPRAPAQPLGRMSAVSPSGSGRSSTRVPLQTQVDLTSDSNVFTGFSTNLSEGGVFVATLKALPVGTPVDLTFSLPGKARIAVHGEVRWTREIDDRAPDVFPGVGVRFVDLSPEAAQALHRFVAEREPLFYPD
ncbi:MAG TPA: TIGR02266 family protein [Myxococcaceae bacterium]|nr:TIGR02266 family protein [Myxococcaceae bacterium]